VEVPDGNRVWERCIYILFKIPSHPFKKTFIVFVRIRCEGAGVFKLLKYLQLLFVQVFRYPDIDIYEKIASAVSVDFR
jgi:hypothetical protein